MAPASSPERLARRAVGALFIATGAFKLALWPLFFAFCHALFASLAQASAGPQGQVLGAARAVGFLTALAVPPLEVACGVALWRGVRVRLCATLLALDMVGAILSVGVPGQGGRGIEVRGARVGEEAWRLPLEVALLLACAWLASRPTEHSEERLEPGAGVRGKP